MEFLCLALAHFMALLSPGPDFFLIVQTALRLPLRYAFSVCAGIASANGVYVLLAVLGFSAIREYQGLALVLKYLGSGYLIYIGFMLLRSPMRPLCTESHSGFIHVRSLGRQFTLGFLSGILNPKNGLFYLSLFTVMVSPQTPFVIRCLYGVWMVGIVLAWDMGVAVVLGNLQIKARLGRWVFAIEKVAGTVLTLFGVLILAS